MNERLQIFLLSALLGGDYIHHNQGLARDSISHRGISIWSTYSRQGSLGRVRDYEERRKGGERMKRIAIQFGKRAWVKLQCLAMDRNQEPVECIRDALSLLSTIEGMDGGGGLRGRDGLVTVHSRGEILKFAF